MVNFFPYAPPGHLMVMIFFMLSGYVIGLTNQDSAPFQIYSYLKKRILRLYPIYLISILLTVILFPQDGKTVLGNLLFFQNLFVNNLPENDPLWSINAEVVFYLLIIPALFYRWKSEHILYTLLILLAISFWVFPYPAILEAYLVGFFFWVVGFRLSREKVVWQASPNQLVSVLLFLLGTDYLNSMSVALKLIPIHHGNSHFLQDLVSSSDFALVPVCLYAMLIFTGINKKATSILFYVVYASSFIHLAYLLLSGSFFKTQIFIIPTFFLVLSLIVYYIDGIKIRLHFLTWIGSLSYPLYVIHSPIMFAFAYIPFWGGTTLFFFVRMLIIVPLVIGISYVLEKKFQPFVKQMFTAPVKISNV